MPNVSPNIKGRGGRGGHRGRNKLTPNKSTIIRASDTDEIKCKFCSHGGQEDKVFGKLHSLENVSAHYNCLLFSSGLAQNGEEEEGIKGFYIEDIIKEVRRSSKLKCCYCHTKGASIGCLERKCKRSYHFLCGLKAFALFQFTGIFSSYCVSHRPFQEGVNKGKEVECPICMEELIADPKTAVWAPCCKKDDWFHKDCVQNMANSAGYFFKCPLCNDKDTFTEAMQLCGIHVPEQDAEWELEPNAFSDLYERRIHCDAPVCKCPEGRKQDDEGTRWEILLCDLCGTTGVHIVCGKLSFSSTKWNCSSCIEMLEESGRRSKQEVRERRLAERNEKTPLDNVKSRRGSRQSLNVTLPNSSPSRTVINSSRRRGRPAVQRGRRGSRQSLNVTLPVSSPSRMVITSPSTPKRRRTSDPLVLPRKIARIENTPIKEAKRALLTPNKEPVVELERIKITHISDSEDIDIEVEDKVSLSGVSRSLTELMECETTSSSDIKSKENTSCGANNSDKSELICDIKESDTPERSDLEIKNVNKENKVDEIKSSGISVMEMVPNINKENNHGLSPDDNIRTIEESGSELPEDAIELKNFALLAQEIMNELQLSEAEVFDLASNSTDIRENFAKSDIARFFRYNLSIKKMKEIRKLLESVFAERESVVKASQQSTHKKKPKEVSPTSKNILSFLSPTKTPSKDIIYVSDSTPTKDKDVKSNENIDMATSVSTKDEPVSPMKRSNKIKSVASGLVSDKSKSSTCDKQINKEELEPKISKSEENPAESPTKMVKLGVKMRSSPRKHQQTLSTSISSSKTGKRSPGPAAAVAVDATTSEGTGNLNSSIMEVPCGNQSKQPATETPRTSPRSSFGSSSLLGSPTRRVPKSRIASPEKIAQGCILTLDEEFDESSNVPSESDNNFPPESDNVIPSESDNNVPSESDNNLQKSLTNNSADDPTSESSINVLNDTGIPCNEKLVPINNQDCTITTESTANEGNSNNGISHNADSSDFDEISDAPSESDDNLQKSLANNSRNADNTYQEEQLSESDDNLQKSLANNSRNADNTYQEKQLFESDNLQKSLTNNSRNADNTYQEEQLHCSAEESRSESTNNILNDTRIQYNEQLVSIAKKDCTYVSESIVHIENTINSNTAISHNVDSSVNEDFDESSDVPSESDDNSQKSLKNNSRNGDNIYQEEQLSESDDNSQKSLKNNSRNADNTYQEEQLHCSAEDPTSESSNNNLSDTTRLVCKSNEDFDDSSDVSSESDDNSQKSLKNNSRNADNTYQEEQLHGSSEDLTSESSNSNLSDTRIPCSSEQLVPISKEDCTITTESRVNLENKENNSNSAISHNVNSSVDENKRGQASTESHTTKNKRSLLKALRCIHPVSRLRYLRIIKQDYDDGYI